MNEATTTLTRAELFAGFQPDIVKIDIGLI